MTEDLIRENSSPRIQGSAIFVIGGGVGGLLAGLRLREAGHEVTLVDRRERGAASQAATGVVSLKGTVFPRGQAFAAKLRGLRAMPSLIAELQAKSGLAIPHIFQGAYEFFPDAAAYRKLRLRLYQRQPAGCMQMWPLSAADLAREGALVGDLVDSASMAGAFHYPRDLWFHPPSFLAALDGAFKAAGGRRLEDRIVHLRPGVARGRTILEGETASYEADAVVVAGGAYTGELLAASGLPPLPVRLVPGLSLTADLSSEVGPGSLVCKLDGKSLAFHGGQAYLGAQDFARCGEVGSLPGEGDFAGVKAALLAHAQRELGGFLSQHWENQETWAAAFGCRVMSRNRSPLVGFWPGKANSAWGVWVLTGLHKSGFYLADQAARDLTAQVAGEWRLATALDNSHVRANMVQRPRTL